MWGPNEDDLHTWFAVWVTQLNEHVVAEDADDLRAGLEDGLRQLPNLQTESSGDDLLGDLVKFERVFTFTEDGATRKRKQWVLYVDTWMMVVMWQGSSPEEYQYWLSMANYCFATFNLPEALWFATDRDLAGNWKVYEEIRARDAEGAEEAGASQS